MPGGFGMSAVKSYLSSKGFGPGRQEGILVLILSFPFFFKWWKRLICQLAILQLYSLAMEPSSRLGSEGDAKGFFDSVAADYWFELFQSSFSVTQPPKPPTNSPKNSSANGISLSAPAPSQGMAGGGAVINSEEMIRMQLKQDNLIREQLELFAAYLGHDLRESAKLYEQTLERANETQAELDLWRSEHGEFYADGIKGHFTPKKVRVYDSSWNWAKQEALQLYYDIIFERLKEVDREVFFLPLLIPDFPFKSTSPSTSPLAIKRSPKGVSSWWTGQTSRS